ncbi:uncharacterized protein EDB91DRAFT_34678 [Suillus paluster]|uniref:uncharacterized protein n=1 Tax=Suillus paluster TaxID=48578 RepID=UPI001B85C2C8|nr:uncharacterized protein EDB91DRAFT_34678 [Suillus paluster]KAG1756762.1 hypothetical protein EDB91DRAFT_34678 [Suillus paluster]
MTAAGYRSGKFFLCTLLLSQTACGCSLSCVWFNCFCRPAVRIRSILASVGYLCLLIRVTGFRNANRSHKSCIGGRLESSTSSHCHTVLPTQVGQAGVFSLA